MWVIECLKPRLSRSPGHLGVYPESAAVLDQYLPMTIIAFSLPAHPKYPSIAAQNYQPFNLFITSGVVGFKNGNQNYQ